MNNDNDPVIITRKDARRIVRASWMFNKILEQLPPDLKKVDFSDPEKARAAGKRRWINRKVAGGSGEAA